MSPRSIAVIVIFFLCNRNDHDAEQEKERTHMTQPKFIPKPGQVDYTNIRYVPTVNSIVTHDGKILCVKRSPDLRLFPNYWDWVCGFLDDNKSIEDKAREELSEELGLTDKDIVSFKRGEPILEETPQYHKTWFIIPLLVEVRTEAYTLLEEASEAGWFEPQELKKLNLVPGRTLEMAAQFFPELSEEHK